MTKRAMIACGGTGGHLSPGIALAEELVSRNWKCCLLISNKQVDSRLAQKYSVFEYRSIAGRAFSLNPFKLARFLFDLVKGTSDCCAQIRDSRPDIVIGFGGFLSMPALLAGKICGVPTAIHEANRVAGRVTRIVSLFADRIYLPKGVSIRTTRSSRIRFVGMPVRREIKPMPRTKAKRALNFDPEKKLLVVMGGSQGAEALNKWVKDNLDALAQKEIQVYCLTGDAAGADSSFTFKSSKGSVVRMVFCRFSDDMATLLSAADLVVSRSGAGSIAEMLRCRTPGIMIPFPFSADDHQVENARSFEKLGCGIAVAQESLPSLLEEVKDTIYNEWLLQQFRANLEAADRTDALAFMARDLEGFAVVHALRFPVASEPAGAIKEGERRYD